MISTNHSVPALFAAVLLISLLPAGPVTAKPNYCDGHCEGATSRCVCTCPPNSPYFGYITTCGSWEMSCAPGALVPEFISVSSIAELPEPTVDEPSEAAAKEVATSEDSAQPRQVEQ